VFEGNDRRSGINAQPARNNAPAIRPGERVVIILERADTANLLQSFC
jgi:hypothetical protein